MLHLLHICYKIHDLVLPNTFVTNLLHICYKFHENVTFVTHLLQRTIIDPEMLHLLQNSRSGVTKTQLPTRKCYICCKIHEVVLQRSNYRPGNVTFLSREAVVHNFVFLVAKFTFGGTKWCYKDIIVDPEMTLQ